MTTFNNRLRRIEKSAPLAEDPEVKRLELAMQQLNHDEVVTLSTIHGDTAEHTPAQRAALARLEELADQLKNT